NTIFTAALLKDIGKTVLDRFVLQSFEKISALVMDEGLSFREAEKKIIGVDHTELGGMIAKMWKFSPRMVKIIRHHHLTDVSMVKDKEIAVVYLADCICMMIGIGVGSDGLAYRFNEQAMKELGMEANDISKVIAQFAVNIQEVEDLLKVV
ncbi:MAG: HDOD domain-containing protein, partial [Desulfobacula sp.]